MFNQKQVHNVELYLESINLTYFSVAFWGGERGSQNTLTRMLGQRGGPKMDQNMSGSFWSPQILL